ncbi:hypothetical protein J2787_000867 [Chryseobacterium rhizosphaerae]|uniref:Uncharacterized protein n=1 Tax=Chryseobacterium rhizosphaerae TaxID=395937 RepID=A0AAE4C289_9FLAO|nr:MULTISPECIES: hypothetical protein [Chryseobacterium]MBL3550539.1 hypothetical protein [Chryseobacterium sp. KMC2]MDR6525497.1 hypothetical protein [Chryseobacterium rhizosphaerae]
MTITNKQLTDENGNAINGMTDGAGGQISIVNYQNGDFKHTFKHELGHQLGLDGEGYQRPGFAYPNEDSNTIIDNNGQYNVTTMQKAKAAMTPTSAKTGDIFKASKTNPNFIRSSQLKNEVQKFNTKITR